MFTKDKRPFVSAVLEDFGGSIELTAWTEVYERTKNLWQEGNNLIVKGKVKARGERVQLTCLSVSLYQPGGAEESADMPAQPQAALTRRRLQIRIATSENAEADVVRLRQIVDTLKQFLGEDKVALAILGSEGVTKLEMPDLTTGYCPELHHQLVDIVGEENFTAENRV
jgi:DNA polymerase-3 subunit alpha